MKEKGVNLFSSADYVPGTILFPLHISLIHYTLL